MVCRSGCLALGARTPGDQQLWQGLRVGRGIGVPGALGVQEVGTAGGASKKGYLIDDHSLLAYMLK